MFDAIILQRTLALFLCNVHLLIFLQRCCTCSDRQYNCLFRSFSAKSHTNSTRLAQKYKVIQILCKYILHQGQMLLEATPQVVKTAVHPLWHVKGTDIWGREKINKRHPYYIYLHEKYKSFLCASNRNVLIPLKV